jgi:hypothetical protein
MALRQTKEHWMAAHITRGGADECWPASGGGYNQRGWHVVFKSEGRSYLAHRVAWEFANGSIESGLFVLHKCDNPKCCNPAHLFLGTQADNVRDMILKGRKAVPGSKNPIKPRPYRPAKHAKVAAEDAARLYASGMTQRAIAKQFGCSDVAVSLALRRVASVAGLLGRDKAARAARAERKTNGEPNEFGN